MTCGEHRGDLSSSVGVCASCLRERLVALLAAQQHEAQLLTQQLPPILFPRSVSPYVARRKSQCHDSDFSPNRMFFHTPQVLSSKPQSQQDRSCTGNKRSFLRLNIFRSKSDILNSDPPRSSTSWFSSMVSVSRKSSRQGIAKASGPDSEWGPLSTARGTGMAIGDGSRNWKPSPSPPTAAGMGFCLSPLVWNSPHRCTSSHVKHRKSGTLDSGSGEIGRRYMPSAASFCSNRSRKLTDMWRE